MNLSDSKEAGDKVRIQHLPPGGLVTLLAGLLQEASKGEYLGAGFSSFIKLSPEGLKAWLAAHERWALFTQERRDAIRDTLTKQNKIMIGEPEGTYHWATLYCLKAGIGEGKDDKKWDDEQSMTWGRLLANPQGVPDRMLTLPISRLLLLAVNTDKVCELKDALDEVADRVNVADGLYIIIDQNTFRSELSMSGEKTFQKNSQWTSQYGFPTWVGNDSLQDVYRNMILAAQVKFATWVNTNIEIDSDARKMTYMTILGTISKVFDIHLRWGTDAKLKKFVTWFNGAMNYISVSKTWFTWKDTFAIAEVIFECFQRRSPDSTLQLPSRTELLKQFMLKKIQQEAATQAGHWNEVKLKLLTHEGDFVSTYSERRDGSGPHVPFNEEALMRIIKEHHLIDRERAAVTDRSAKKKQIDDKEKKRKAEDSSAIAEQANVIQQNNKGKKKKKKKGKGKDKNYVAEKTSSNTSLTEQANTAQGKRCYKYLLCGDVDCKFDHAPGVLGGCIHRAKLYMADLAKKNAGYTSYNGKGVAGMPTKGKGSGRGKGKGRGAKGGRGKGKGKGGKGVTCYNCGKKGHIASECYSPVTCHTCGKPGHISTNCWAGKGWSGSHQKGKGQRWGKGKGARWGKGKGKGWSASYGNRYSNRWSDRGRWNDGGSEWARVPRQLGDQRQLAQQPAQTTASTFIESGNSGITDDDW